MIKVGDKVKVYQDPITEQIVEGYAIIKRIMESQGEFTRCSVHFTTDGLDEHYVRIIKS